MKLKKIISAVCAFAMIASIVTVANSASLGGKPTMTATFDKYEKVSDTVAFAYVDVTLDMSAAEALEVYSNELDEETWEEVVKGNGITTMGSAWTTPTGFTYTKAKSTIPAGLTVNATSLAFGPKTSAEEYWTEPVTTIKLALRVNDFDAKGAFTFNVGGTTVDGKNSAENAVWGYKQVDGNIIVTGCDIPSYNEWSTPAATPTVEPTATPEPTPEVTPEPTATPEPTEGKGVEKFSDTDAAAWAWKTAAAAGSKVAVTVNANGEEVSKTFDLNAAVEGTVKVGIVVQYNPTTFANFEIVNVDVQ